jgi:two-component system chemotaxis sensor kinase CheA
MSRPRRLAQGKTPEGNLKLTAWQRSGSIWIELADDGKGIDFNAVRASAERAGVVSPDQELSTRELQQLIFLPGLSTSAQVTDISGRGVGMDVVAQTIAALRGTIHLESHPNRGTTFLIQLPLTLAIIDGMLVRAAGQTWVLPAQAITRLVEPTSVCIECLLGRGRSLSQPEGLIPLLDLADLLDLPHDDSPHPVIIVLEHLGQRLALQVDQVLGQQQVVIKSLGDGLRGIPGISGGCILADGRVGLILDVGGLVPGVAEFLHGARSCRALSGAIGAEAGR